MPYSVSSIASNYRPLMPALIDLYPYRKTAQGVVFLLMRRAAGTPYAGAWRMVGGKVEQGEAAWQAALRELREETGLVPVEAWALPSVNAFYEWQQDRLHLIPAFAAEVDADPVLDREHDAYRWLLPSEAARLLKWPEQRRLLLLTARMLEDGVPASLLLPVETYSDEAPG